MASLVSQHLHLFHVDVLAFDVGLSHEDQALHAGQGTDGGGGYTVLSGTGLGNDAAFTHAAGQQHLPHGVVDLVGTGVVQVFALEVDLATIFLGQAFGVIEGGRTSNVVFQQVFEFAFEIIAGQDGAAGFLQLADAAVQYLGDVSSAELTVVAV